ncbi:MAG TPA: hypothetical protein VG738_02340 [Chitinophagaceae bacterium]|nr:hypothetical protein [Chitinophagaceae bacterium]
MATYNELTPGNYYLIQEGEETGIELVQPVMETGKCLLMLYIDEVETTMWKKKEAKIFEIVEELSAEQVAQYEDLFEDDEEDAEAWELEDAEYDYEEEEEESEPGEEEL